VAPDSGHRLMPPVVSRSRGDFGQIHCLLSRAANAFQSGPILPCSAFLATRKTYNLRVFITREYSENIPTPASTNWLQEIIEALFSVRLPRMSLERGFSGR
jgi:hypothetical protein